MASPGVRPSRFDAAGDSFRKLETHGVRPRRQPTDDHGIGGGMNPVKWPRITFTWRWPPRTRLGSGDAETKTDVIRRFSVRNVMIAGPRTVEDGREQGLPRRGHVPGVHVDGDGPS